MFVTFYDKDFTALANNSSLYVESFKLIRRGYDLNEFSGICEPISFNIDPLFAILKQKDGAPHYYMLRPMLKKGKDGKSSITARDLMGVFNTKCFIKFMEFTGGTVKEYLQFIFDKWKAWDSSGFEYVTLNLNSITTTMPLYRPTENATYNIKDLLSKALSYYGLYLDSEIDVKNQVLRFSIKPNNSNIIKIRLEDYGIEDFAKYEPETNTATVLNHEFENRTDWYLLQGGQITQDKASRNIFPTSSEIFIANEPSEESPNPYNDAIFEAVSLLAENRYQENIEIDTAKDIHRLGNVYFDTSFEVYYQGKFYKTLPLGEIEDTGKANKILRIGNLPVEFIQVV